MLHEKTEIPESYSHKKKVVWHRKRYNMCSSFSSLPQYGVYLLWEVVERLVPPLQPLKCLELGLSMDWGVVKKKRGGGEYGKY